MTARQRKMCIRDRYQAKVRAKGAEIIAEARRQGKRILVLAGRPYHVDPEINHGIDRLISRYGAAVITEDSISDRVEKFRTSVLNQWTYHSRLYACLLYTSQISFQQLTGQKGRSVVVSHHGWVGGVIFTGGACLLYTSRCV